MSTLTSTTGGRERTANEVILQREILKLTSRCQDLQRVMAGACNSRGRGKNKTRTNVVRTNTDMLNIKQVYNGIKGDLYPLCKILPVKFYKFSTNKRSVCHRVMEWVTIPAGTTEKDYWNEIIAPEVSNKYCHLKSNFTDRVKKAFEGTCG